MPRITVYIPDELANRMTDPEIKANWSEIAQKAFTAVINMKTKVKVQQRITFTVSFIQPVDSSVLNCKEYIEEAVKSSWGSLHPTDPMFELDYNTVRVTRYRK